LNGSLFKPDVLTNLSYVGETTVLDETVSEFTGYVPVFPGNSTWYTSNNLAEEIVRVAWQTYVADTVSFQAYPALLPSVFQDPITYCNDGRVSPQAKTWFGAYRPSDVV